MVLSEQSNIEYNQERIMKRSIPSFGIACMQLYLILVNCVKSKD